MSTEEAVKAAADALLRADEVEGVEDEDVYDYYLRVARAALEAAAPFIRAEALEKAAGSVDCTGPMSRELRARAAAERDGA